MHELRKKSLAEKASSFWRALHSVSRFELTELRVGVAMSAMGQKQTFALQQVMSALPPKADILYAERKTSAKCQYRTLNAEIELPVRRRGMHLVHLNAVTTQCYLGILG
jgi:hypothetical protein